MDPEKTIPPMDRLAAVTAKADGPADKLLRLVQRGVNWCFDRAIEANFTPWIIVAVILVLVWAGVRLTT